MKKITGLVAAIALLPVIASSQQNNHIQSPTFGVHFFLHDFRTAELIRKTSLAATLRNKEFGKVKEMSPGLAVSYVQGLSETFDFSTMLAGSFLEYPKQDGTQLGGDNGLLLEGDVSIRGKMFSNKYWVSPFVQLGVGVSKFQGYWGAFIPAGVGLQLNLFDEAFLMVHSQYRVPVTETTANFHFFHSIGLAGIIGKKK